MIEAKPVIPNQYWILREDDRKIGNIEADQGGYVVNLKGSSVRFQTLDMLRDRVKIDFKSAETRNATSDQNQVHGYPTTHRPYNSIWDVHLQIPLWTKESRSKSWLAAGWYRVRQHKNWQIVCCPKRILLERYEFAGPFYSREDAMKA